MAITALATLASKAAAYVAASWMATTMASYAVFTTVVSVVRVIAFAAVISSQKQKTSTPEAKDRKQMIRSPVAARTIVYGEARVSGPIVFAGSTGAKNKYLHLVIVLAGHEIDREGVSGSELLLGREQFAQADRAGDRHAQASRFRSRCGGRGPRARRSTSG